MNILNSQISVPVLKSEKLKELLENTESSVYLLDVREPEEYEITHINGSILIPMMEIQGRLGEVLNESNEASHVVVICRSGKRSELVAEFLIANGLSDVFNLEGGILEFAKVDSDVSPY